MMLDYIELALLNHVNPFLKLACYGIVKNTEKLWHFPEAEKLKKLKTSIDFVFFKNLAATPPP